MGNRVTPCIRIYHSTALKNQPAHLQKCWPRLHGGLVISLVCLYQVFSPYIGNQVDKPSLTSQCEQEDKAVTEEGGILKGTYPGEGWVTVSACEEQLWTLSQELGVLQEEMSIIAEKKIIKTVPFIDASKK